jgi:hypothetical protein
MVVDAAVLLSKFKRYTHRRDCGVRSTVTMVARGEGERYGDGEEERIRKRKRSVRYGWTFVTNITSRWPTNRET